MKSLSYALLASTVLVFAALPSTAGASAKTDKAACIAKISSIFGVSKRKAASECYGTNIKEILAPGFEPCAEMFKNVKDSDGKKLTVYITTMHCRSKNIQAHAQSPSYQYCFKTLSAANSGAALTLCTSKAMQKPAVADCVARAAKQGIHALDAVCDCSSASTTSQDTATATDVRN